MNEVMFYSSCLRNVLLELEAELISRMYDTDIIDMYVVNFLTNKNCDEYNYLFGKYQLDGDINQYKNMIILMIVSDFYAYNNYRIQKNISNDNYDNIMEWLNKSSISCSEILKVFKLINDDSKIIFVNNFFNRDDALNNIGLCKEYEFLISANKQKQLLKINPLALFMYADILKIIPNEIDYLIDDFQELDRYQIDKLGEESFFDDEEDIIDDDDFEIESFDYEEKRLTESSIYLNIKEQFLSWNKELSENDLASKIGYIVGNVYSCLITKSSKLSDDEKNILKYLQNKNNSLLNVTREFIDNDIFSDMVIKIFLNQNIDNNIIVRKQRDEKIKKLGCLSTLIKYDKYYTEGIR